MTSKFDLYDDVEGLERYLNLPKGALSNIPIYARVPAVDAIIRVRQMEASTLFRPGLYYIVLADLRGNTAFNAKYGNAEGDVRVEWFQTAVIQSIGEISPENYVAFSKTIGDAALLIFSAFRDVFKWSQQLTRILEGLRDEYPENLESRGIDIEDDSLDERLSDFDLKARRLVHLGEVSYKEQIDPLSLAVSQTFKIEKVFDRDDLGFTQTVYDAVSPALAGLNLVAQKNAMVEIPGASGPSMTYYLVRREASKPNVD
jgi:class 3 adenylate cyclase